MDDSWRDIVGRNGMRLRTQSDQEPYSRIIGSPQVDEAKGRVKFIMNTKDVAHWVSDLLFERFPDWRETERSDVKQAMGPVKDMGTGEAPEKYLLGVTLRDEDAKLFVKEWNAYKSQQPALLH